MQLLHNAVGREAIYDARRIWPLAPYVKAHIPLSSVQIADGDKVGAATGRLRRKELHLPHAPFEERRRRIALIRAITSSRLNGLVT